ncbi:hypothetical protein OFL98_26310, partial [Escherichia coli]|nr:hypothetical protein [Escherichia coli]
DLEHCLTGNAVTPWDMRYSNSQPPSNFYRRIIVISSVKPKKKNPPRTLLREASILHLSFSRVIVFFIVIIQDISTIILISHRCLPFPLHPDALPLSTLAPSLLPNNISPAAS